MYSLRVSARRRSCEIYRTIYKCNYKFRECSGPCNVSTFRPIEILGGCGLAFLPLFIKRGKFPRLSDSKLAKIQVLTKRNACDYNICLCIHLA